MRLMKYLLAAALFLCPIIASADEIQVNNRILTTVNGTTVSVLDVMKKMDIYLRRAYPDQTIPTDQKFQFYQTNWRYFLKQVVDNHLILADAEKLEIKITDGDVREQIHERFGPNVMASLDELGITLEEAHTMIYRELAVQRMSWYRFQSKAMQKIGPQEIKNAYNEYIEKNPPQEEWKYQVLSIRATTEKLGNIYAQKAHALLRNDPLPFAVLVEKLQEGKKDDEGIKINISDEYTMKDKDLSETHRSALCILEPGSYSDPIPQVSRRDGGVVHRIFYLKDHIQNALPSFSSLVDDLHDKLVHKEIEVEMPKYLSKLYKRFNFDEGYLDTIPADFQPFSL